MPATQERLGYTDARHAPIGLRRPWLVFGGVSAALHVAAIVALIDRSEPATAGQSGQLEAISIEVSVIPSIGAPEIAVSEPQEASKQDKTTIKEEQRPPDSEEAPPLPRETALEKKLEDAKTASAEQAMAQIEAHLTASGASAGDIEKYGREVSLALARSVLKGKGQRGKVTLAFVLASDGKIERLEVVSPSGDASLDEAAQNAVRKTAFPPPPQGMTEKQRTYVIPFRFR
jgi:TonB family protein